MKKLITILMVLAIVVGAVFAESEAHSIRIKSDVDGELPMFQLILLSSTGVTYNEVNNQTTNTTPNAFGTGENDSYAVNDTNATAVDVGFNLDEGGTVTFIAKCANAARFSSDDTGRVYTLVFTGGVFKVSRYGVASTTTVEGEQTVTTYEELIPEVTVKQTTNPSGFSYPDTINNGVKVKIGTSGVKTGTDAGATMATAEFKYTADKSIDPGTYYADVTLTITQV